MAAGLATLRARPAFFAAGLTAGVFLGDADRAGALFLRAAALFKAAMQAL
jgi:hypothetical protein